MAVERYGRGTTALCRGSARGSLGRSSRSSRGHPHPEGCSPTWLPMQHHPSAARLKCTLPSRPGTPTAAPGRSSVRGSHGSSQMSQSGWGARHPARACSNVLCTCRVLPPWGSLPAVCFRSSAPCSVVWFRGGKGPKGRAAPSSGQVAAAVWERRYFTGRG